MTDGAQSGTSGKAPFRPPFQLGPWGLIALVSIPIAIINATSVLIEMRRVEVQIHPAEPFFWEFSSAAILVMMAPLVGRAVRRWPLEGAGIWTSFAVHLALTIPFSVVHVFGLWAIRQGFYTLIGGDYNFFADGIGLTLLYEWRKDIITYAVFAGVFAASHWLERRRAAAESVPPPERIEIREGGRTLFLAPADILFLEAAGNYVELNTASAMHLVRGTLAAWDQKLAPLGFVRIHRSRLVNKAQVTASESTGSGDFEVTLSNGRKLQGSRRFRAGLN